MTGAICRKSRGSLAPAGSERGVRGLAPARAGLRTWDLALAGYLIISNLARRADTQGGGRSSELSAGRKDLRMCELRCMEPRFVLHLLGKSRNVCVTGARNRFVLCSRIGRFVVYICDSCLSPLHPFCYLICESCGTLVLRISDRKTKGI